MKSLNCFLLLGLLLGSGLPAIADDRVPEPKSPDATNYQIQPLDVLRIQVFQEADMTAEVRVSKEGAIELPLIGSIRLIGLHTDEAAKLIERQYKEHEILVSPSVTITVLGYTNQTVNVLGAVNAPGTVQIPPETRFYVLDAITKAGGFSRLADMSKLSVIRRMGKDGTVKVIELNVGKFIKGELDQNIRLEPEDVIYVKERNY